MVRNQNTNDGTLSRMDLAIWNKSEGMAFKRPTFWWTLVGKCFSTNLATKPGVFCHRPRENVSTTELTCSVVLRLSRAFESKTPSPSVHSV